MSRSRKPPNLTEKLASCLLIIADLRGEGISFEIARELSADQICSLFHFDHAHRHANGGTTHPTNLTPRWIAEHREKTAKIDTPQIRKGDRLAAANDLHVQKMRAKILGAPAPREAPSRWPKSRKLNTKGARIQSRPFQKRERV